MTFQATTNLSYRSYFGPGAVTLQDGLDKTVRASLEKREKRTTYFVAGSWSEQSAAQAQRDDLGFATVAGTVTTTIIEGNLKHQFNNSDTVTLSSRATRLEFTGSNATPSDDLTSTGEWLHRLNRTTDLSSLLQYELIDYHNAANTQAEIWRATGGFNAKL